MGGLETAMSMRVVVPSAVLTITALGCSLGAEVNTATVRDSAGVRIVENSGGTWLAEEAWTVATDPTVDIGVLDGAAEYQLFRVRDARRLSSGNIVVANGGTELRFYDATGAYLSTAGREGGGPGEFEGLQLVRPYLGDSLLTYDFNQVRISLWDQNGNFGRSYKVNPPGEFGFILGEDVFADGTLLARAPHVFRGAISEGAQRRDEEYNTYSMEGELIDTVGTFPGPDQFMRMGRDGNNMMVEILTPPFGRGSYMELHGDQLYFGSADSYEIERRAKDGALERLIRRDTPLRPVTAADVERFVEDEIADIEDANDRRDRRELYEEMEIPETMPAYQGLKVDDLGNLWVEEYESDPDAEARWSVFDPDGRMLGEVVLPNGLAVMQIGPEFVLGVWRDEFDVEHVRMYELVKPMSR
jgi:hypothetical protein